MSLPTNTWIEVERAWELPRDKKFLGLSIDIDLTDGNGRKVNQCYNFRRNTFGRLDFTPTHFMIIELPKK